MNGGTLSPPPPGTAGTRFVNAVADASALTASVSGVSDTLSNIAFATDSGFVNIPIGSYTVQMASTDGSGQIDTPVTPVHIDTDNQTTLYAIGAVADDDVMGLPVEKPVSTAATGYTEVQFVNASTSQAHMQVFVVPAGQEFTGTPLLTTIQSPVATLVEHPAVSDVLTVPSGAKRIALINGHDGGTQIFGTSASTQNAPVFPDGGSIQIAIIEAPGAKPRPDGETIQLLVLDNNGGASFIIPDGPH
jgi:hypothetical protein